MIIIYSSPQNRISERSKTLAALVSESGTLNDVLDVDFKDGIFYVHSKNELEKTIDNAASGSYEKIVIFDLHETFELIPEKVDTSAIREYLQRKRAPFYTMEVSLYDVSSLTTKKIYSVKVRSTSVDKKMPEAVSAVKKETIEEKPLSSDDPVEYNRATAGLYASGVFPTGTYSSHVPYGAGVSIFGTYSNPWIIGQFFDAEMRLVKYELRNAPVSSYESCSLVLGAGYYFDMRNTITCAPSIDIGYISHIVPKCVSFDPIITFNIKGQYHVPEYSGSLFLKTSYSFFIEKNKTYGFSQIGLGYERTFEWVKH